MIGTLGDIRTKTAEETLTERSREQPFRIALLGDFSGRASRGEPPRGSRLSGAAPLLIDSENFAEVIEKLNVSLRLESGAEALDFRFQQLDDFHPDRLYQTHIFENFRKTLEQAPASGGRQQPAASPPTIDQALGELMRGVLGHPRFQALEAAWRSVFFLLQRIETGANLRIELIDITIEELLRDMLANDDSSASGLYRMLVEEAVGTPGRAPWSALVPLETILPREQDLRALERLAGIARIAGAPVLAGAHPAFVGCESIARIPDPRDWKHQLENAVRRLWEDLRHHWAAAWIGLAMPRFLLRLPYGREALAVKSFDFDEMPNPPVHEGYLWGSPAVACACMLACAYNKYGWNFRPGKISKLEGIPLHAHGSEGSTDMTPAAEIWMSEAAADRILDHGIMPLASIKNSDAIQLVRFQSIAMPPRPLAGPWG